MASDDVTLCFSLFDKDGSGKIGKDAAATALRTLGKSPSTEDLEELLDGASEVDLAKFTAMYNAAESPDFDEVQEAFSTFDVSNNGYIPLKELMHLMKTLGEGLPDDALQQLAKECDPDEDDQVNYSLFVKKMFQDL
ncbi:calmodulin [Salpingoeca rosetta]|uniref:Calmodulin n=1 Tax=Salpingoeca rosetta (strain ATCC 50818 / BSB-021) TaxID=946362 RepID=F2U5E5_SALR5|nr:calmodulin [Salpingoeca rosetta]EGD83161.1 calmodulin [Salpingoeca rosetta]|eukprot:XP_004995525.1 calmodulin [Salpingoeca rosetta]